MSHLVENEEKRFLIIVRAGNNSLHKEWLNPIEYKNYDLCISYYGDEPGRYQDECDFYFACKGPKWPIIKEVIQELGDKIWNYDAIWFPDDDIRTNAYNIQRMFERFVQQGFELAQPALTEDSHYSHFITLEHPEYLWRYSSFVEVMVPIFSKKALKQCWHSFDLCQSGWGIDLLWPKVLGYPHYKIAIIDETPVQHTRPVGAGTLYNGLSPFEELDEIVKKYELDQLTYQSMHYDGVLRNKRLFVLVLAHKHEDVLEAQIQNIRYFNPNVGIILYNGGKNKDFAKSLKVAVCPYSVPIKWAHQARVLWDVMRWLEETNVDYEYIISFDHDMLFVKYGFEEFLDEKMKDFDCMGWQLLAGTEVDKYPDPRVPQSLWNEWKKWQPIFQTDNFLRYFNPGQVFRRQIIRKMIPYLQSKVDEGTLNDLFSKSKVYGFEEMFSVTLALSCGGRCAEYPDGALYNEAVRWGDNITIDEVKRVIKYPSYFWIHPIKTKSLIEMHQWLISSANSGMKRAEEKYCQENSQENIQETNQENSQETYQENSQENNHKKAAVKDIQKVNGKESVKGRRTNSKKDRKKSSRKKTEKYQSKDDQKKIKPKRIKKKKK